MVGNILYRGKQIWCSYMPSPDRNFCSNLTNKTIGTVDWSSRKKNTRGISGGKFIISNSTFPEHSWGYISTQYSAGTWKPAAKDDCSPTILSSTEASTYLLDIFSFWNISMSLKNLYLQFKKQFYSHHIFSLCPAGTGGNLVVNWHF